MNLRHIGVASVLLLGLAMGPVTSTIVAQDSLVFRSELEAEFPSADTSGFRRLITRKETEGRALERTVVERPSINGGSTVLFAVEDETVRVDAETTRRTRRKFHPDPDGRLRLVLTIEEDRVDRPDGGRSIVRSFAEPDVNGRIRIIRRETEETVPEGGGVFRTDIEVSGPGINSRGFVPTERVEHRERRDGEEVLEIDRTIYGAYPSVRGTWEARERRIVNRDYVDDGVQTVESVYTLDGSRDLTLSDRIVSREWIGDRGREYRTDEIFARDIPGQMRSRELRRVRQVEVVRTGGSDGGWTTSRAVKETRGNRIRVVERVIEKSRPDGRGGTVVNRETQQMDVNGRFRTVAISRTRESGPS